MERLKIVVLILGSSLWFEACNLVKTRIPTVNKGRAQAVNHEVSRRKTGRRRAQRNKSPLLRDPEYRRLLERARRWKEQQQKHRTGPVAPPTDSSEIADANPLE